MASGIYRLTFASGDTYVGKSVDIDRRWAQHFDKLRKGTAAAPVQDAYRRSGHQLPQTQVLLDVHPDLLDEYEGYYIHLLNPSCNTSMPTKRTAREYELLEYYGDRNNAQYSFPDLVEYCRGLDVAKKAVEAELTSARAREVSLAAELDDLEEQVTTEAYLQLRKTQIFREVDTARDYVAERVKVLVAWREAVKALSWWDRLWGHWPRE